MKNEIRNVLFKRLGSADVSCLKYEPGMNIKIGRAADNDIQIDLDMESVSRYHAEIAVRDISFQIRDLQSTNGLYVNDIKVQEQDLMPGDKIRLGKNGPEYEFDLDPRPASLASKTRIISVPTPTREISSMDSSDEIISDIDTALGQNAGQSVGKQTVERMIQSGQAKSKKINWVFGALSVLALALAGYLILKPAPDHTVLIDDKTHSLNPQDIASKFGKSVVMINNAWKLVYTPTGEDIYHYYEYDPKMKRAFAVYFKTRSGIEPYCVTGKPNAYSKLMAGNGQGSGFVANPEGFIVTNRHVANTWLDTYGFPPSAFPGRLMGRDPKTGKWGLVPDVYIQQNQLNGFNPSRLSSLDKSPIDDKSITGELFYTDVLFPGATLPISATVNRVSDRHDVAILKINSSSRLISSTLKDHEINQGQKVSVMGYPGLSPREYEAVDSKTMINSQRKYETIANPSIFDGIISKKIGSSYDMQKTFSMGGDTYQLNISESGKGNSGGPLYDDQGNVIGIYTYGFAAPGYGSLSFAVPIKYALELLSVY